MRKQILQNNIIIAENIPNLILDDLMLKPHLKKQKSTSSIDKQEIMGTIDLGVGCQTSVHDEVESQMTLGFKSTQSPTGFKRKS